MVSTAWISLRGASRKSTRNVIGAALAQDASSASAISHPARMCLLP
jgi:hypothetical protein